MYFLISISIELHLCNTSFSLQNLLFFTNLFGCHLWHCFYLFCPGFSFPMKLLQQPQKGQSEVLKSGGHKGTPWELSWSCRSTLLHSSNLVLVRPPSPGTQQKIDAQLKRQDGHFTRSLEQKQQRDLHSFLSSCLWCLHSFITTSLSLPILNPLTVRGLNVASSWFKNDAAWLSPPISGGTKGILNPSKFQKKLVPNQTANPHQMLKGHLCLLPDRRHLGTESQLPWK